MSQNGFLATIISPLFRSPRDKNDSHLKRTRKWEKGSHAHGAKKWISCEKERLEAISVMIRNSGLTKTISVDIALLSIDNTGYEKRLNFTLKKGFQFNFRPQHFPGLSSARWLTHKCLPQLKHYGGQKRRPPHTNDVQVERIKIDRKPLRSQVRNWKRPNLERRRRQRSLSPTRGFGGCYCPLKTHI